MLHQSFNFLLIYRSIVLSFVVLSLIASGGWLIVRLFLSRTPGYRLSFRREILLLTFVVYLSGLAAATLLPNRSSRLRAEASEGVDLQPSLASLTCSSAQLPMGSTARAFCVRNAAGNVILFFPLGILLPLLWRRLRFWSGLQVAIAVSVSVELVQYLSRGWAHRTADVNDVILNSLGACLGLMLVSLLRLRLGSRRATPHA